jgi:CheY-like chemotaxis protein/CHASE3 domain sensor protein
MAAKSAANARRQKARNEDLPMITGLVLIICFFLGTGYITYTRIEVMKEDSGWVTHTYDVLLTANRMLSLLKDAETGQRGYVITGNTEYLEPYNDARAQLPLEMDRLKELTSDNPEQQQRIASFRALAEQRLNRLELAIKARQEQGFEAARDIIMAGQGKQMMEKLRDDFTTMTDKERALREERVGETEASFRTAIAAGVISCMLSIALAVIITYLLARGNNKRRIEEWFQAGQAGLSGAMLGDLTIAQLGNNVLKYLAEYLDAHAGIFFAREETEFKRAATYGFEPVFGTETLNKNDSLLGQAIKDARSFIVEDVPDGYLRVSSGLGGANPRHLVVSSAFADGMAHAVFELGFVHKLNDATVAFLEHASKAIGVAVQSANYRSHLQTLLEETQAQSEELQTQAEELRVSNEELEEQSRALKESQARLEQQQEELQVSNEELEEKTQALELHNQRIKRQSEELEEQSRLLEEKAQELELSGKYKSEFLANMSHELRTPLNSLLILAKNLANNEEGNLTAEQVEESNIIYNGGLDLLNLINDILDLSKVEAGKLNIITDDTAVRDILRRMEQQFTPVADQKEVDFKLEIADDIPSVMHTDAQRVEQILKNLLSNAFKFTEKGSVTLRVARPEAGKLRRTAMDLANTVAFSVADTGIGIEETKLNSIFEAFQQEDGSTDRHYGGTGLGLTIGRKFAHMLGGEIHVTSKKGEGSTFTLLLPEKHTVKAEEKTGGDVKNPPARIAEKPQELGRTEIKEMPRAPVKEYISDDRATIGAKDKTLLIIEDDRDFAHILMKTAQKRGFKCLVAGDGKTGILIATEQPVSAILLDLRLPDLDGLAVLDQLKHDLRTRHIPVHIMTGFSNVDAQQPLRKGAIGMMTKPVSPEQLDVALARFEDMLQASAKKVLIVEDDRKSQVAIQNLLKKKDLEITCIGMGKTALERLDAETFDCIILDLSLPDMTGFDWLDALAKKTETPPPVIVYTAKELTEEENRKLSQYTGSIVIKGAHSSERLLDEVTLFLHSLESTLSKDQQAIIRMQHNPDRVLRGRTVLLVDDDLRNTFAMSKMLKKHGMNVVIADNGQMALDKLKSETGIELVIMDIMMPVMDGYEAMRAIRSDKKWSKLPVIALTARAMPEEQERCMAAGANDYLTKPVDLERLLTLMRVWLFKQDEKT